MSELNHKIVNRGIAKLMGRELISYDKGNEIIYFRIKECKVVFHSKSYTSSLDAQIPVIERLELHCSKGLTHRFKWYKDEWEYILYDNAMLANIDYEPIRCLGEKLEVASAYALYKAIPNN